MNSVGQLGLGDDENRGDSINEMGDFLPSIEFPHGFIPTKLVAGWNTNCVLDVNQMAIVCWGGNWDRILGDGGLLSEHRGDEPNEMGDNMVFIDLGTDFNPIDIALGGSHACAMSDDQEIKCWGENRWGQLGNARDGCYSSSRTGDYLPVLQFPSGFVPSLMGLGGSHSCVVSYDETPTTTDFGSFGNTDNFDFFEFSTMDRSESIRSQMICFGSNGQGQLGYKDTIDRGECSGTTYENITNLSPIDLGSDFEIAQIQIMSMHNCILSTNDELKCFGANWSGQLGYGDTEDRGDDINEMGDYLEIVQLNVNGTTTNEVDNTWKMRDHHTEIKSRWGGIQRS